MRLSNDEYYLHMLEAVAERSTCVRRKVGAIIVDRHARVLAMGFNGVPRGFPHCIDIPCAGATDAPGDTRRCLAVHAELNAILTCPQLTSAATLYVSTTPCTSCALAIANTPITRVVAREPYADMTAHDIFQRARIELLVIPRA